MIHALVSTLPHFDIDTGSALLDAFLQGSFAIIIATVTFNILNFFKNWVFS